MIGKLVVTLIMIMVGLVLGDLIGQQLPSRTKPKNQVVESVKPLNITPVYKEK
jgi:hypothetical protein